MGSFSGKKLLLYGVALILLIAIPLTVYLAQKQQQTQSNANPSTNLTIKPPATTTTVGQTFSVDVMIDPGQNLVSFVKLQISYDATKLTPSSTGTTCNNSVCPNTAAFPATLEGPTATGGAITVSLSVGADPTKVVQTLTKVATITFSATAPATTPTDLAFGNQTQVLSISSSDQPSENVLSSAIKGTVTINAGTATPTATPGPQAVNQSPVCTAFNIDRTASGPAPFSLTFTAVGNDPDGTINKVTFNFGDGVPQDLTQSGGIGTKSVSAQMAHTYNSPGSFSVSAVLTDNNAAVSVPGTCIQTVTVSQGSQSAQIPPVIAIANTPTPFIPTPTELPKKVFPTPIPSGPGETIVGIGLTGIVFSIIAGFIFLAL